MDEDKSRIVVHRVTNPHMFWYTPELTYSQIGLQTMEEEVFDRCYPLKAAHPNGYEPQLNEIVCFLNPSSRLGIVRAKVVKFVTTLQNTKMYVLFEIDYGTIQYTSQASLLPLQSISFRKWKSYAEFGGLYGVVPINKLHDVFLDNNVITKSTKWSAEAVSFFEKIIQSAKLLNFTPVRSINCCEFGILVATLEDASIVNVNNKLCEINEAVATSTFESDISDLDRMFIWQDNNGNSARNAIVYYNVKLPKREKKSSSKIQKFGPQTESQSASPLVEKSTKEINEIEGSPSLLYSGIYSKNTPTTYLVRKPRTHLSKEIAQKKELPNNLDNSDNLNQPKCIFQPNRPTEAVCPVNVVKKNESPKQQPLFNMVPAGINTSTIKFKGNKSNSNLNTQPLLNHSNRSGGSGDICMDSTISNKLSKQTFPTDMIERLDDASKQIPVKENADSVMVNPVTQCVLPKNEQPSELNVDTNREKTPKWNFPSHPEVTNMLHDTASALQKLPKLKKQKSELVKSVVLKQQPFIPAKENDKSMLINPVTRGVLPKVAEMNVAVPRKLDMVQQKSMESFLEDCIIRDSDIPHVLWHGNYSGKPVNGINDMCFSREIYPELKYQNAKVYGIQMFAWPHLMRGDSAVIVNGPKTGKTMCYLPVIYTQIANGISNVPHSDESGPLAVILCSSSDRVYRLASVLEQYVRRSSNAIKIRIVKNSGTFVSDSITKVNELLMGHEILVSTVPALARLLEQSGQIKLINHNRLRHFVIDDVNLNGSDKIVTQFKKVFQHCVVPNRALQLIVTSQVWSKKMWQLLKIMPRPALCIGSYIEAAVYNKTDFSVQILKSSKKQSCLATLLEDDVYSTQCTLIVGLTKEDKNEIRKVVQSLSIIYMEYNDKESGIIQSQSSTKNDNGMLQPVWICTDMELSCLNLRTVKHIIHYSFPPTWSAFSFRFSASIQSYEDKIKSTGNNDNIQCSSLIFLDENNSEEMPKLIRFINDRCNAAVPPDIVEEAEKCAYEKENNNFDKPLCFNMLNMLPCEQRYGCKNRHRVIPVDAPLENVPTSGMIRYTITKFHSPVNYSIRLLAHRNTCNEEWNTNPYSFVDSSIRLQSYYNDSANHVTHHPVSLGDLCVIHDNKQYFKCRVINIVGPRSEMIFVRLSDCGTVISCARNSLLVLTGRFKRIPEFTCNISLIGISPQDEETNWDKQIRKNISSRVMQHMESGGIHLESNVEFALIDTVFTKEATIVKTTAVEGIFSNIYLKKELLLDAEYVVSNYDGINSLKQMAKLAGIIGDVKSPGVWTFHGDGKNMLEQSEESESISDIIKFSSEDGSMKSNVSNNDIDDFDTASESNCPKNVQTNKNNDLTEKEVSIFSSVLSKFSLNYCSIPSGNRTLLQALNSLKLNKQIDEKPKPVIKPFVKFEILNCGEEYSVDLGGFYSPSHFYLQNVATNARYQMLLEKIDVFATSSDCRPQPSANLNVGTIGLLQINGDYARIQVTKIVASNEFEVFIVDVGNYSIVFGDEIFCIPDELIDFVPFQSILCQLVGINSPANDTSWTDDLSDKIYDVLSQHTAYYAKVVAVNTVDYLGADRNNYDIVLSGRMDDDEVQLNSLLILQELATVNPKMEHFLGGSHKKDEVQLNEFLIDFDFTDLTPDSREFAKSIGTKMLLLEKDANAIKNISKPTSIDKTTTGKETPNSPIIQSIVTSTENEGEIKNIKPQLVTPAENIFRIPDTIYYETEKFIVLKVAASDITKFNFQITKMNIMLVFSVSDTTYMLNCNLFGSVSTSDYTIDQRGLKIMIKLRKDVPGKLFMWPRLCAETDRLSWLKYDYDALKDVDIDNGDDDPEPNFGSDEMEKWAADDDDETFYNDNFDGEVLEDMMT